MVGGRMDHGHRRRLEAGLRTSLVMTGSTRSTGWAVAAGRAGWFRRWSSWSRKVEKVDEGEDPSESVVDLA